MIIIEIKYNIRAHLNLTDIKKHITYDLHEPHIAKKTIIGIENKIKLLQDFPYIGRKINDQERILIYKNYLIFYEIQENENLILILRILYTKRNYLP